VRLRIAPRKRNFVTARAEDFASQLEIGPMERNFVAAREEDLTCC
jgi:hypothetical protein